MTARMVLDYQVKLNENQLRKVLAGLSDDSLDFQLHPNTLSVRGELEHLAIVYGTVIAQAKGEEAHPESYSGRGKSLSELEADMFKLRDEAVATYDGKEDEASLQSLNGWIVLHDNYHIGQLSMLHQAIDESWDSHVLY